MTFGALRTALLLAGAHSTPATRAARRAAPSRFVNAFVSAANDREIASCAQVGALCYPTNGLRSRGLIPEGADIVPTAFFNRFMSTVVPLEPVMDDKRRDREHVDTVTVIAIAGAGGNGSHALHQARGRHALADGGDGGQGGSVVVRASSRPQSLAGILKTQKAASGGNGTGSKMHGRNAPNKVILVPLGTSVFEHVGNESGTEAEHRAPRGQRANQRDAEPPHSRSRSDAATEEQPEVPDWIQRWRKPYSGAAGSDEEGSDWSLDDAEELAGDAGAASSALDPSAPALRLVADLVREGEEVVLARGGAGGRGNSSMRALPGRPVPRTADPGSAGSRGTYTLELKLLADVGLLGLPNVGKSSLLRALTGASPRVAAFAFTTLRPQLGALQTRRSTSQLVLADIPGLIPGASVDRGLGHAFLRHVERTKALTFVVDLSRGRRGKLAHPAGAGRGTAANGADPEDLEKVGQDMLPAVQLRTLVAEVRAYAPELLERPALVVANKVDLVARPAASLAALEREAQAALGAQVVAVSALGGTGLEQLELTLDALVQGGW